MTKFLLAAALLLQLTFAAKAQEILISSTYLSSTPADVLNLFGLIDASYDVSSYKLVYNTTGANGEPTIASGIICIPTNASCTDLPLGVYCHGTVLAKYDVPSAENFESLIPKFLAAAGYIGLAPDYIGLGDSPGLHPYIHTETEATATLDLIRAAREFLPETEVSDNGQLFITGYSQGGHAAMATHKYIQDHELESEFNILASAPGSGPYNLSGSQAAVLLSGEPYSNPGYVVYLIMSYDLAYNNLYTSLEDVIEQPYADLVAPYFDGQQNSSDMGVVNNLLPPTLQELLVDSVLDNFSENPQHPLWQDLRDNDNYNWAPQVPVRMYYCTADEQVDYHNSLAADSAMQANGAPDVAAVDVGPYLHGDCALPALTAAFDFFSQYADLCVPVSVKEHATNVISLYPSPAHEYLQVDGTETPMTVQLYNSAGRLVLTKKVLKKQRVSVAHLPAGIYIARVESDLNTGIFKVVLEGADK